MADMEQIYLRAYITSEQLSEVKLGRGFSNETIEAIHNAYRIIYQSGLNNTEALKKIEKQTLVVDTSVNANRDLVAQEEEYPEFLQQPSEKRADLR